MQQDSGRHPSPCRVIDQQTLEVLVKVVPKASAQKIVGVCPSEEGKMALKVMITAVPEGGKANVALIALLAKTWHMAKSKIQLHSGETSRLKSLRLSPLSKEEFERVLQSVKTLSELL